MENEYSIEDQIGIVLAKLDEYEPGSDERSKIIKEELEPLYRLHNDEKKIDNQYDVEMAKIEATKEIDKLRAELDERKFEHEANLDERKFEHEIVVAETDARLRQQEIIMTSINDGAILALKLLEKGFDGYVLSELAYFEENRMFRSKALNEALKKIGHRVF